MHVGLHNVLPGAMVRVYVDGMPYGSAEAYSESVRVPLVGPPFTGGLRLRNGQTITADQYFPCREASPVMAHRLPVEPVRIDG